MSNNENRNDKRVQYNENAKTDAIPAVVYNNLGVTPNECKFYVSANDLKDYIKTFASVKLDGVHDVSLFAKPLERRENKKDVIMKPICYLILRDDSDDLVDKNAKQGDTVIWSNIPRPSQALKSFAVNYAADGQDFKVLSAEDNRDLKVIELNVGKIVAEIFDAENKEYKNRYGSNAKGLTNWEILIKAVANDRGELTGLHVTKKRHAPGKRGGQIAPRKNGKF